MTRYRIQSLFNKQMKLKNKKSLMGFPKPHYWQVLIVFLFPILCVALSGNNQTIGRLISSLYLICILILFSIWATVSPYQKLMGKHAKLCHPRYSKAKNVVFPLLRFLFGALGLVVLWFHFIPLSIDVSLLMKGEKPLTVEGIVTAVVSPFPLLEFISQEISLEHNGQINEYRFYYSLHPRLREGNRYELVYLKHSNVVLEARVMPVDLQNDSVGRQID